MILSASKIAIKGVSIGEMTKLSDILRKYSPSLGEILKKNNFEKVYMTRETNNGSYYLMGINSFIILNLKNTYKTGAIVYFRVVTVLDFENRRANFLIFQGFARKIKKFAWEKSISGPWRALQ